MKHTAVALTERDFTWDPEPLEMRLSSRVWVFEAIFNPPPPSNR